MSALLSTEIVWTPDNDTDIGIGTYLYQNSDGDPVKLWMGDRTGDRPSRAPYANSAFLSVAGVEDLDLTREHVIIGEIFEIGFGFGEKSRFRLEVKGLDMAGNSVVWAGESMIGLVSRTATPGLVTEW